MNTIEQKAKELQDDLAGNKVFIMLIFAIIGIIFSAIQIYLWFQNRPQKALYYMRNPTWYQRMRLKQIIRRQTPGVDADAVLAGWIRSAHKWNEADVVAMFKEVKAKS